MDTDTEYNMIVDATILGTIAGWGVIPDARKHQILLVYGMTTMGKTTTFYCVQSPSIGRATGHNQSCHAMKENMAKEHNMIHTYIRTTCLQQTAKQVLLYIMTGYT